MAEDYYTTTEASRLLSVSPDTVLKWVRAGKIDSYRTPGGHARIPKAAVASLLPERVTSEHTVAVPDTDAAFKYCWDFYACDGEIEDQCHKCVAYRSRARRCYEMRDIPEQFGHLKLHCETDCKKCEYYMTMAHHGTSAMIVSRNKNLAKQLPGASDEELTIKFASSEYECAALIDKFRPDYAIVDCSFGAARTRDICHHLTEDERIPLVRIILTSRTAKMKDYCDSEVFGWIIKPFTLRQLKDLIEGPAKLPNGDAR